MLRRVLLRVELLPAWLVLLPGRLLQEVASPKPARAEDFGRAGPA